MTAHKATHFLFLTMFLILLFAGIALGQSGTITAANFGYQCGFGELSNCKNQTPPPNMVWISSQAQPGLLRLHDAGTYWSGLNPNKSGSQQYNWTNLDAWLDLIAEHQPIAVAQQFAWVPCWIAEPNNIPQCDSNSPPNAPGGSNIPPTDLQQNGGSAAFNGFITAFVQHCTTKLNCVGPCPTDETCKTTNLITHYQMWNEWNLTVHWTGSVQQLYYMIAPAVAIIRQYIPTAIILMPSATPVDTCYAADFGDELTLDGTSGPNGGHLSDWIDFHVYLTATATTTNIPELQWANYVQNGKNSVTCTSQAGGQAGFLDVRSGLTGVTGWSSTPWVDSETNYDGAPPPGLDYTCPVANPPNPPTTYSQADCTGQMARWQLLHDSNSASGLYWYYWNTTIGGNSNYEPSYYNMMKFMTQNGGGKFTNACNGTTAGNIQTWTCNFTQGSGKSAQFVWTTSELGTTYPVPGGFGHYLTLTSGQEFTVMNGSVSISVEPIVLIP